MEQALIRSLAVRSIALATQARLCQTTGLSIALSLSSLGLRDECFQLSYEWQKKNNNTNFSCLDDERTAKSPQQQHAAMDIGSDVFETSPTSTAGYAACLREAVMHCSTEPLWARCAANELRRDPTFLAVPATISLCTEPVLSAYFFASVCEFQSVLMKHWVAQQQLWICQPYQLKLHLHTLIELWRDKKWNSVDEIVAAASSITTGGSLPPPSISAREALFVVARTFCDMLLASRKLRKQRVLLVEFVQDHQATLAAFGQLKLVSMRIFQTASDHLRLVHMFMQCFEELQLTQPLLTSELVDWTTTHILKASPNVATHNRHSHKKENKTKKEKEDVTRGPQGLSAREVLLVAEDTKHIWMGDTSCKIIGQLLTAVANAKYHPQTSQEDATKILRLLSIAPVPKSPAAVSKLIDIAPVVTRSSLKSDAKQKKKNNNKNGKKKSAAGTKHLSQRSSSGGCSQKRWQLSASSCGDIATALDSWSRIGGKLSSADRSALTAFHSELVAVLRVCAKDAAFAKDFALKLAPRDICAIATVAGKNTRLFERDAGVPISLLDRLLRSTFERMESVEDCILLWNAVSVVSEQLPELVSDSKFVISRNLSQLSVAMLGQVAQSPTSRRWVNQWVLNVQPTQLADPIRDILRKVPGWCSQV